MADRLRELGFALDDDAFMHRESIGRPHLADAVLAHPDNAERLAREGITGKKELFPPYLVPGAAAYVARSRPTVEEAIEVIHAAGGVAVWAHPFWDVEDPEEVLRTIERFAARRARRRRVLLPRALARAGAAAARRRARRAGCSRPARPTSTAPSTSTSAASATSSSTAARPRLGPIGALR